MKNNLFIVNDTDTPLSESLQILLDFNLEKIFTYNSQFDVLEANDYDNYYEAFSEEEKWLFFWENRTKGNHEDVFPWENSSWKQLFEIQFQKDIKDAIDKKKYFFCCPLKIYKDCYNNRLQSFKETNYDALDIDFIIYESELYSISFDEIKNKNGYFRLFHLIDEEQKKILGYSKDRIKLFLTEKALELGYSLVFESSKFTLNKINNSLPSNTNQTKRLKWKGTKQDFIELTKALKESDVFNETHNEIVEVLTKAIDIEITSDISSYNQKLKKRNIGSETLFLDKLKDSMLNYIKPN